MSYVVHISCCRQRNLTEKFSQSAKSEERKLSGYKIKTELVNLTPSERMPNSRWKSNSHSKAAYAVKARR